jgi:bacterial/archaeal transporter family-2 protein
MAGALALDHFGALGFPERPVTMLRLAGVACVVVGVLLLSRE